MKQDELTQQLGKQTLATSKACQAILPLIWGLKSKQEPFVDLPSHQRKFKLLSGAKTLNKSEKNISFGCKQPVNHHAFADYNHLYKISTLDAIHYSIETLQNCTMDVKSWMNANKLQVNHEQN